MTKAKMLADLTLRNEECTNRDWFPWTGRIPCTGVRRCPLCL